MEGQTVTDQRWVSLAGAQDIAKSPGCSGLPRAGSCGFGNVHHHEGPRQDMQCGGSLGRASPQPFTELQSLEVGDLGSARGQRGLMFGELGLRLSLHLPLALFTPLLLVQMLLC